MGFVSLTGIEFKSFQGLIYELAGISLSEAKSGLVAGRLMKRLRHFGFSNYSQYLDLVKQPGYEREKQTMVDLLTTNQTHFFREIEHFEILVEFLRDAKKHQQDFSVWSAACSTGEEVYSIAMTLAEHLTDMHWVVKGSDINFEVVEAAKTGIYRIERSKDIPNEYLKKYCRRGIGSQSGKFCMTDELKAKTQFRQLNLIGDLGTLELYDIIFLRNVMIYFNEDTRRQVVKNVLKFLKPNGKLILGHSESLHRMQDIVFSVRPTIYTHRSRVH